MTWQGRVEHRRLLTGQSCVVHTYDASSGAVAEVYRTTELLLEAPNWVAPGELILNGDGALWRLELASGSLTPLRYPGLPDLNNDHVPAPGSAERDVMYVSGFDWHIHRLSLTTGEHHQVTHDDPDRPMRHFLHGVSPDGGELAYVGVEPGTDGPWGTANIFTTSAAGGASRQLTSGDRPSDGPEYSPDGEWIYFNTEMFAAAPGHAQIARIRPDGSELEQLTSDARVNWFPHLSPAGDRACYLSYPPGTIGHPENRPVELRSVTGDDWGDSTVVARLHGGQGTINVNSWHPNGQAFAYVSYPHEPADATPPADRFVRRPPRPGYPGRMTDEHSEPVTVAWFADLGEAEVAQAKLRSFGIESALSDESEGGVLPVGDDQGIQVQVRAADADDARAALADAGDA